MVGKIFDFLIDAVTSGNRPMRIFFFGGVFLALFVMLMLDKLFGVKINNGGEVDLLNVVVIIISLFIGFGLSFGFVYLTDLFKRKRRSCMRNDSCGGE